MSIQVQVTFDARSPESLGTFWCAALGYVPQAPPDGYATWSAYEATDGTPVADQVEWFAAVDPVGPGPRLYFQKVPEPKILKNRVHLDLNVSKGASEGAGTATCRAHALKLVGLGATIVEEFGDETSAEFWIVMHDPEGNELCIQ